MTTNQPVSPDFSLSKSEAEFFKKNGYIGPFTLYSPDEMKLLWRRIRADLLDRSQAAYPAPDAKPGDRVSNDISNYDRHLDVDPLAAHVCRPEIVHRVRSVLGPDVLCWRSEFFPKYPGDPATDWHQADIFANGSGRPQIVWTEPGARGFGGTITVWAAFTEASERHGCLRFIPGTHEKMFYDELKQVAYNPDVPDGVFGYRYKDLQIDPNWSPDESKAVSMVMRPGQFIIFWSTVMHASFPNTTEREQRVGFSARYVPTQVRVYPDTEFISEYGGSIPLDRYGAVLVSGQDKYGHNKIAERSLRGYPFPRW